MQERFQSRSHFDSRSSPVVAWRLSHMASFPITIRFYSLHWCLQSSAM